MDKRYQVFISSTYADLVDERRHVIQTLMEMDYIPAGMELFPAIDEEQWQFIKRVIDDCDYYILIIGGRYGSTTAEGISYTEKEYHYAVERGLKVLAFVHESPDSIPVSKSDIQPELRSRLATFREKVKTGRLVKFWKAAGELPGLVALNLQQTMKRYPAVGWVRANQVANSEALNELNTLRKENRDLEAALRTSQPDLQNLAGLDENHTIHGTYKTRGRTIDWQTDASWGELFGVIAPYLLKYPVDSEIKHRLKTYLHEKWIMGKSISDTMTDIGLDDQDFQTVKVQLMALKLVAVRYLPSQLGHTELFWSLTAPGKKELLKLRSIKTKIADAN